MSIAMTSAPTDAADAQFAPPPQPTSRKVSSPVIFNPAKSEIDLDSVATMDLHSLGPIRAGAHPQAGNSRSTRRFGLDSIHRSESMGGLNLMARGCAVGGIAEGGRGRVTG